MEEEVDYYERLDRHRFGLPVDVFIDCTNCADLYHHPILIYFRNSYNENSWNKLPLTVEETPRLYTDAAVNIYKGDLRKIIVWVARNREYLIRIAREEMKSMDFWKMYSNFIFESITFPLSEMAQIGKDITGLKYKVWVDDDMLYLKGGHSYRIKIETTDHKKNTNAWNSLRLDNYEFIGKDSEKYKHDDKESIVTFAKANENELKLLADKKIPIELFMKKVKKVVKTNGVWGVENDDNFSYVQNVFDVMHLVTNDNDLYNIITYNNEWLSDEWFVTINTDKKHDIYKKKDYYVILTQDWTPMRLYSDGEMMQCSYSELGK